MPGVDDEEINLILHGYHMGRLEIYRRRSKEALTHYTKCLDQLKTYSEVINKTWFDIPLQCAQDLVDLSREIEDGLSAEKPDFNKLLKIGKTHVTIKRKLFNPIANMAYRTIHLRKDDNPGFNKKNLMETALQWNKLLKAGFTPPYDSKLERDFVKLPWVGSFWKVFSVVTTDIFKKRDNDWMELMCYVNEGFVDDDEEAVLPGVHKRFDSSLGACCSSATPRSSRLRKAVLEEKDNYTEFFEAQFKEFNELWEKFEQVGSLKIM